MPDSPAPFDFGFPPAPGGGFPAVIGDPGEEAVAEGGVQHDSDQHIIAGHKAFITFDSFVEIADSTITDLTISGVTPNPGWWDPTDTNTFTLPQGAYLAGISVHWEANATGWRYGAITGGGTGNSNRVEPVESGSETIQSWTCFLGSGAHNVQVWHTAGVGIDMQLCQVYVWRFSFESLFN